MNKHYCILIKVGLDRGDPVYKYYKKDGVVFKTTSLSEVDDEMAVLAQDYALGDLFPIQELDTETTFSSTDNLHS